DETAPVIGSADIDGNSTDGYTVTGEAQEPGDTIEVRNEAGEPVGSGIIGEDGSYTVDIDPALVSENETLYVVGVDEAGNESDPTEVVVPEDPSDTTPPELSDVGIDGDYINGYSINGVTDPGSTVTFTNEAGENIGSI